jgi:hypothetical protein
MFVRAALPQVQEEPFPHADHEGLFPLCTGCHSGVPTGDRPDYYPTTVSCANCHDGQQEDRVDWAGAPAVPTNVQYDHLQHVGSVELDGQAALTCEACHTEAGSPRMTVQGTELPSCWACHTNEDEQHFVASECATCHVPLAESEFGTLRIDALAVPADHEADGFLEVHQSDGVQFDAARCATCHTQDRCLDCHVDVWRPEIGLIPAAPESMTLPETTAEYPVPGTHEQSDFSQTHGLDATRDDCATCHTQDDCASCHVGIETALMGDLPRRSEVRAPGVELIRTEPVSHASPFFITGHSVLAAATASSCANCHTQETCTNCHDGPTAPVFHPDDFLPTHPAEAYGVATECANCHSVQVFCRSCHVDSGLQGAGGARLGVGFHDAEPLWLLRHGQAARQSLEACASCHAQNECVQCHSVTGAFQINPHGPGFDAGSARDRNPAVCLVCHITIPGGRE